MATKGKRPMRALSPQDKIDAIQRVNDGESKASVARDIGVPESTLRGWCKNIDKLRYMTSRRSTPDTDKSNDSEPPTKRACTESPVASPSPADGGLDLTAPVAAPVMPEKDKPVELTTKRTLSSPTAPIPREHRPDPGSNVSMSAISPLSGLNQFPILPQAHLGLSFNDIANNLTLLAQLKPQQAGRPLRSFRSTNPVHTGALLNDSKTHQRQRHHQSDPYRLSKMNASHRNPTHSAPSSQSVDDALWYWLRTQQTMLDLTAQKHNIPVTPIAEPQSIAAAAQLNPQLDINQNPWIWQYYKHFIGTPPVPEDKPKPPPKEKSGNENILYSQLTKGKMDEGYCAGINLQEVRQASSVLPPVPQPVAANSPGVENEEPPSEKNKETSKVQVKERRTLDMLSEAVRANVRSLSPPSLEGEAGAADALLHGTKFLQWLEASGDSSLTTHVQLHQLRELLKRLHERYQREPDISVTHTG